MTVETGVSGAIAAGERRRVEFLVNIDVPDLEAGVRFYRDALGFELARRLGPEVAEMTGGYQLLVPAGLAVLLSYIVQYNLSRFVRYRSLY